MKFKGKLTNWNDSKGFGFVTPIDGGESSFVHIKSFKKNSRRPVEGDLIIYKQLKDNNGKFKAINIKIVNNGELKLNTPPKYHKLGTIISYSFSAILILLFLLNKLPIEILYFYAGINILSFISYSIDKAAAKNNRWRTPESQLHLISLFGGWVGAFFAQDKLRHKSSKKEFKAMFWTTAATNIFIFIWLLTEQGQRLLNSIFQ